MWKVTQKTAKKDKGTVAVETKTAGKVGERKVHGEPGTLGAVTGPVETMGYGGVGRRRTGLQIRKKTETLQGKPDKPGVGSFNKRQVPSEGAKTKPRKGLNQMTNGDWVKNFGANVHWSGVQIQMKRKSGMRKGRLHRTVRGDAGTGGRDDVLSV